MRSLKIFIIIILFFSFIFYFLYKHNISAPLNENGQEVNFAVRRGEGVKQISHDLYQKHLIKSRFYFELYVWLKGLGNKLQAGVYLLSPKLNIKDIVGILASGKVLSQERDIKIIEGWNIKDINSYLKNKGVFNDDSFLFAAQEKIENWPFNFSRPDFLADVPPDAGLEGFLFPDTYRIYNNTKTEDIIFKMLSNFDQKLDKKLRDDIVKQEKTVYEIITMASLIEKEVRDEDDMRIVSGIFWNRIKRGQPLESCATLAYVLGVNKKQYTQADTQVDSPYNTYSHSGLPPGPICNPSLKAIKAAIYPIESNYNYFLTSSRDGRTIFSRTYQEHLRNKAKYLSP